MNLSNEERKQLREALISAYPSQDDLEIFVDEKLDKNLAVEAGPGRYDTVVFNLIKRANARGYVEDLILALSKDVEGRGDIQRLCARVLQRHLVLNPTRGISNDLELELEPSIWDVDVNSEELERFLPKQFTFEADVGKLQQGLKLASAVCKITFLDRPGAGSGTGVLVAPDLVLTNYHVLSSRSGVDLDNIACSARFEFGYVSAHLGEAQNTQVMKAVSSQSVVSASSVDELDYALIRLSLQDEFVVEPVPLNVTTQLQPRSPLNILQHPEGEEMKVSLSNNGVVKTNEERGLVLYVNPTKLGSSGSPCFDSDWKLIALHHKKLQTSFGSVREGILFKAIHAHIQASTSMVL